MLVGKTKNGFGVIGDLIYVAWLKQRYSSRAVEFFLGKEDGEPGLYILLGQTDVSCWRHPDIKSNVGV